MRYRVPYIPQMEAVECGAASLAMVLAYYGHHAPLSEVRQACSVSRDGSTAHNIVQAAASYGLSSTPLRVEPEDLAEREGPAILHWDMNHFVVLEEWTPKGAFIADPGVGLRFVAPETFDASFTGICIEFEPDESFVPRPRIRASAKRYLALLRGAGRSLAMVLFASLALDALATVVPLLTQFIIDHVLGRQRPDWLFLAGASAAALVTFAAFWSLVRGRLLMRLGAMLDVSITQGFVAHLFSLPIKFFAQRSVGDLMARVQANRLIRALLAGQSIALLADGVMLVAYLALMLVFDLRLGSIVVVAALVYVVVFLAGRPVVRAGADEAQCKDILAGVELLQILRGITTIKSAGVERSSQRRWLNAWIASLNASARVAMKQQTVSTVLFAIQVAVPVLVLFAGGRRVLAGDLTPGRLVGFQMLQAGFLGPLQGIVQALLRFQIVPVLLGRMDDVLLSEAEPSGPRKCPRLEGTLELENVVFAYSPASEPVLRDVSMKIEKGTKVALVGPSGSGKSTLARLLLGLYVPTEGTIRLDGHDLSELSPSSFRRQYGVVLQETALFDGTIADNLRLFNPNAPLEHVVLAARVAQIHDDVLALPQGYDTRITANGGALSGGQRQRLALARAIVHRPPIMILDEATSALDAVTEAAIERYLTTRACTRIVIAHRMSTVRDADTIFVLEGGRIVERGRHDELLAGGGLYARLVASERDRSAPSVAPPAPVSVTLAELEPFEAFRPWTNEERAELAERLARITCAEGTRVVEQDARGTGLYLIAQGKVSIELAEPGLAPWKVADLGPGAIFGEIGLLDGSPASASVVAESEVSLLHLSQARFQELLKREDVLGLRATLALGAVVAERTRDAMARCADATDRRAAEPRIAGGSAAMRAGELPLAETLLGASLDASELRALERLAVRVSFPPGKNLFSQGETADTVFVLAAGHVALRRDDTVTFYVADAGAIVAEAAVFHAETHATSGQALDLVVAHAIGRDALVELLLSGRRGARKLLAPIAETLVRRFRLANFRLREAVALKQGELDRAHAAREQVLETTREERDAFVTPAPGRVPAVTVQAAEHTAAACLASLQRGAGRPVSLSSVLDAFATESGTRPEVLGEVARSMGLTFRLLDVPLDELSALDAPIVALLGEDHFVVLEKRSWRGWRIMDPLAGERLVSQPWLEERFSGQAFELRDESAFVHAASLPSRLVGFARTHAKHLVRLLGVTLLVQGMTMGAGLATALAVQRVFPFHDRPLLGTIVAASAGLALALAVMQQLQARAIEHLRAHFDRELVHQMMSQVLALPIAFFDRFPPGEVLQRFRAFENVRLLFSTQGVVAILNASSLAVGAALLLAFSPRLIGVALAVLVVYAAATRLLFPAMRRHAADGVVARGRQQDRLIEVLQGIVTLRMAGDASRPVDRWLPSFLEELSIELGQDRILTLAAPALDWTRGLALVFTIWLGARAVLEGSMSLGALVAFLSVLAMFLAATHGLAMQVLSSAPSLVDYGLVRSTFLEPHEQTSAAPRSPGELRGRVTVDQVSFRYTADGPLVLQDVSLEIRSGTKVALVGASGSGKSTLGRLLLGLYLPTSGRVLFDGKDVTSLDLEALRRRMGVVLQDTFLLGGSIRENIALGAEGATLDRIVVAAQGAAIHDDIEAMAMGYETRAAEGGATFSGGQRQRIAIARALLSHPAVLLLDEATSALDNLSQAVVESHLARSTATRIVIAHRLSTIVDADHIVVLHKGRIVDQGTHDELVAREGPYLALVRAQL